MFAKIFEQIFDSSIAEDWQIRHVFEDLLKLCDRDGIVDRTPEAIARRTNVPLEVVARALAVLEQPDPHSRNPGNDGRRIVRLDAHRNWGWRIVNYEHYRQIASDEQRRTKNLGAVHRYRDQRKTAAPNGARTALSANSQPVIGTWPALSTIFTNDKQSPPPAPSSSVITRHRSSRVSCHAEAEAEADEKLGRPLSVTTPPVGERERDGHRERTAEPEQTTKPNKLSTRQKELADRIEHALGLQWVNDAGKWIGRIRAEPCKSERVIAELENAAKENRIRTTPAQFAEDTWGRFAG